MSASPIEVVRDAALNGVRVVGDSFTEPDDDWAPVLFAATADKTIGIIGLDPNLMNDKDFAASVVTESLQQVGATAAALITSAWRSKQVEELMRLTKGNLRQTPSEAPDREEIVAVTVMDRESASMHVAVIERRDGKPPTLGEWDDIGENVDAATFSGRFPEAILAGLGGDRDGPSEGSDAS